MLSTHLADDEAGQKSDNPYFLELDPFQWLGSAVGAPSAPSRKRAASCLAGLPDEAGPVCEHDGTPVDSGPAEQIFNRAPSAFANWCWQEEAQDSYLLDFTAAAVLSCDLLVPGEGALGLGSGEPGVQAASTTFVNQLGNTRELWSPMMQRFRVAGRIALGCAAIQAFFSEPRDAAERLEPQGAAGGQAGGSASSGGHRPPQYHPGWLADPRLRARESLTLFWVLQSYHKEMALGSALKSAPEQLDVAAAVRRIAPVCKESKQPLLSDEQREQLGTHVADYVSAREAELRRFDAALGELAGAGAEDGAALLSALRRALQGAAAGPAEGSPALRASGLLHAMKSLTPHLPYVPPRERQEHGQGLGLWHRQEGILTLGPAVGGGGEEARSLSARGSLLRAAVGVVGTGVSAAVRRLRQTGEEERAAVSDSVLEPAASQLAAWEVLPGAWRLPEGALELSSMAGDLQDELKKVQSARREEDRLAEKAVHDRRLAALKAKWAAEALLRDQESERTRAQMAQTSAIMDEAFAGLLECARMATAWRRAQQAQGRPKRSRVGPGAFRG